MAKSASDQSEDATAYSEEGILAIMYEDAVLEERHSLRQFDGKPLDEVFNAVIDRVQNAAVEAAKRWSDKQNTSEDSKARLKQYLHLNRVLLGLQHWANDIKVENKSPLSITDKENHRFNRLALILRAQFIDILFACSAIYDDKVTENDGARQNCIDHLDQLSSQLGTSVAPLKTIVGNLANLRGKSPKPSKKGSRRGIIDSDTISRSLKASNFDTGAVRSFAPNGSMRSLILPDVVRATLAKGLHKGQSEVDQDIVDYVVFRARNLFAICLMQHLEGPKLLEAMIRLKMHSISDADLPLEGTKVPRPNPKTNNQNNEDGDGDSDSDSDGEESSHDSVSSASVGELHSRLREIDPEKEIWDYSRQKNFIDTLQWQFLAPVFSTKDDAQDFKKSCVLPFPSRSTGTEGGGFGIVARIEIQDGHIEDPDDLFESKLPKFYALKQFRPNASDYQKVAKNWTKELANLRSVTRLKHPNILRFVTAFRRGDGGELDHFLICEWADGGNLRNFWESQKSPTATVDLIKEVVTQLRDLADALCTLHYSPDLRAGIVHGDLKPENIIRFKPEGGSPRLLGTLKIGDWGLSKEKDCKTTDQNIASIGYRASIRYEPPEMSEGVPVVGRDTPLKSRSRLYDVWSLGCIMLEFIVWLVEGTNGLSKLSKMLGRSGNNQFWEKRHGVRLGVNEQLQVRSSILDKMEELSKHPACRVPALRDLLHLVRNRALVVHLPTYLAALTLEDMKYLESDRARLESADAKPSQSAPGPRRGFNRAQTIDWLKSSSFDSEDPHAEAVEIVEEEGLPNLESQPASEETQPKIQITGPDASPTPTASPNVVAEPKQLPRAKATELLKAMRDIVKSATDQATESTSDPGGSSSSRLGPATEQPLSETSDTEFTVTSALTAPSLVFSDAFTATTSSVETVPNMPNSARFAAASKRDPPSEISRGNALLKLPGSLRVPEPQQDVGDNPEQLSPH